jgi:protein-S-isoprenylcysteine O-methyltransferase Ste14
MSFAERGGWWVVAQGGIFAVMAVALLWGPRTELPAPLVFAGWLLVAAGMALALDGLARIRLHLTAFPAPLEHGRLVEHGAFRLVRHPIYGGLVITATGLGLVRASLFVVALAVALGAFFVAKSAHEERLLAAAYPDYAAYRTRVPRRIIPWLV